MTAISTSRTRRPLARVWSDIRPSTSRSLAAIGLASLSLACAIGLIATSAWLISRAWQQPPILALGVAIVAVRAFGLGRGVFRYSERLVSHDGALRGLTNLRTRIVDRLAVISPSGVPGIQRGDAVRRIVDDVDGAADVGLRTGLPSASATVVGIGVVAFVAWLLPSAAALLLVGLLVGGIVAPAIAYRVGARATGTTAQIKGELSADIVSQFDTCADVVANNASDLRLSTTTHLDRQLRSLDRQAARSMGISAAIGVLAQGIALIGVLVVAIPAVNSGELPGVDLAVVVLIPLVAFELVASLPAAALALARSRASARRIVELLDSPNRTPDPAHPKPLPARGGDHVLRVRNLSVRWAPGETPALRGVNLEITSGKRIAIVGPSGSGKSTLAAALVKFVPFDGSASLDGIDYGSLSGDSIRRVVGLCLQNSHIFDNTIAANVLLARPDASESEVEQALREAHLWDWVSQLPLGITTPVGEHGAQLSGGQRQRLALARSALARPPIAVYDEPTEHLDRTAATEITDNILSQAAQHHQAVVLITHTLTDLDRFDEILVLAAGQVRERGTAAHLMRQGGWFATNVRRDQAYASDITLVGS